MSIASKRTTSQKIVLQTLKIVFLGALLSFFAWSMFQNRVFEDIRNGPKNIGYILLGILIYFSAVGLALTRWHILVRAAGIPIPFRETLRIGVLTLFVCMLPMTALLGGDLFKIWMLSRFQAGKGAESVASMLVDRFLGLFAMFAFVTAAAFFVGFHRSEDILMLRLFQTTTAICVGFVVTTVLLLGCPEKLFNGLTRISARIPWAGPFLSRLAKAIHFYRSKPLILLGAFSVGFLIQALQGLSLHLFGTALFERFYSLGQSMAIVPLGLGTIFIPISIGPLEIALDWLYASTPLSDGSVGKSGVGFVVAVGFRFYVLCLAGCGFLYYLCCPPSYFGTNLQETVTEALASLPDDGVGE